MMSFGNRDPVYPMKEDYENKSLFKFHPALTVLAEEK